MTDEIMHLRTLVEKTPNANRLGLMMGFTAHRLMELEIRTSAPRWASGNLGGAIIA